jgi:hypothetical protein
MHTRVTRKFWMKRRSKNIILLNQYWFAIELTYDLNAWPQPFDTWCPDEHTMKIANRC